MKKLIAMLALIATTSVIMAANVLVYDYAVTFKNLKVSTFSVRGNDGKKYRLDSAKVASDKFTGYVVVNSCKECNGDMEYSTQLDENAAVIYVTRKGDSKKRVYRAVGQFRANMFGAKTGVIPGTGEAINPGKATEATGMLMFPLDWNQIDGEGFLGRTNFGVFDAAEPLTYLYNAGFGKVTRDVTKTVIGDDCYVDVEIATCYKVKSMSGFVLGESGWTGHCGDFLFDICSFPDADAYVPVAGTFSLKLNNSKEFKGLEFAEAEEIILKKMSVSTVYVPMDDAATEELGLIEGVKWTEVNETEEP